MQVWGAAYIDIFINAALPAQLVDGNLLKFPYLSNSTYEIFTTKIDRVSLEKSEIFKKLCSLITVNFNIIDDIIEQVGNDNKWKIVRHCHKISSFLGDERNSAVFYLHPDQLWSQGSFRNAATKIVQGYSVVLCPGPISISKFHSF